jgi:capsular polysaccharide biosynthesis protein
VRPRATSGHMPAGRIRSYTISMELERLAEGKRRHAPTIAYRIDGAVLSRGSLYFGEGYEVMRKDPNRLLLDRNQDCFAGEMQLCTNYVIERYFGHWVTDGLVLELLATQRSVTPLKFAGAPWIHESGYRELCNLHISRSQNAWVGRLWVIDDRAINDRWISRVEELRRRVRSMAVPKGAKRVMLARGLLGSKRNLVNCYEVEEALVRRGFDIVYPESETVRDLADKLCGSEIVITIEGSVQGHCILAMPRHSSLIVIQPPRRFNGFGKERADAAGINYGYVIADPHPDGFILPTDRLIRTIDEVAKAAALRLR